LIRWKNGGWEDLLAFFFTIEFSATVDKRDRKTVWIFNFCFWKIWLQFFYLNAEKWFKNDFWNAHRKCLGLSGIYNDHFVSLEICYRFLQKQIFRWKKANETHLWQTCKTSHFTLQIFFLNNEKMMKNSFWNASEKIHSDYECIRNNLFL